MRSSNKSAMFASLVLAAACGSPKKSGEVAQQDQAQEVDQAQKQEKPADLPVAAIVRVPVGADGKEDPSKAELRLDSGSTLASTKDAAIASFEAGKIPDSVKASRDELDKDSSTQSWFLGCLFNNYNYSYNYGYNYNIGYGNYNNFYNYGNPSFYGNGGYNYYYYPYGGYGLGGGVGGGYGGGIGGGYGGGIGGGYGGGVGGGYGGGIGGGYGGGGYGGGGYGGGLGGGLGY